MAIWNPWHGCHKLSPGCANCYVYRRDESIGKDASIVTKNGDFTLPRKKNRQGQFKLTAEDGEVFTCMTSDFFLKSGIIEDTYLYNRCHLIGYQLTGENDNERNLITGTRYMNVEGMEPFECKVANYVKSFHTTVLYRVTPVFAGDELVARGVLMEAMSLDASAAELQFCVYCYNVQPNIEIDYATGESRALIAPETHAPTEPALIVPATVDSRESAERTIPTFSEDVTYIQNMKSMKFHYPSCQSVADIAEYNRFEFKGTRDEAIASGYQPCKRCNP